MNAPLQKIRTPIKPGIVSLGQGFGSLLPGLLLLGLGSACGSGVGEDLPCEEIGAESCVETMRFRCNGERWASLGECHYACLDEEAPGIEHSTLGSEEIWRCEEGPHVVTVPLSLAAGGTLEIVAGSEIRFMRGSRIDTTASSTFSALGTAGTPILFTADDETQGGFGSANQGGLNLFATDPGIETSQLTSVIVERGVHGVAVLGISNDRTDPLIEASTFRDLEGWGILLRGCETGAELPDYTGGDNRFFANGEGAVSECQ